MARRPLFLAALLADTTNFCGGGASACETDCGHVWCDVTDAPSATAAPTFAGGDWHQGTYTTGYWDCCKPSCSWSGKGDVDAPVLSCEAETGAALSSPDVTSVCDGGTAASCASNQPWTYNDGVSLGFAAAAVGGITGLDGDTNCGQCYELVWTDDTHSWGGGAHASLVGRTPNDDDDYPALNLDAYASDYTQPPTTAAPTTLTPLPTARDDGGASTAAPTSSGGSKKKQNPVTRRVRAGGVVLFAAAAAVTFVVGFAVAACVFRRRTSKWQTTELDHTHSWGFSPPNEAKAVGPGGDWQRTSSFNGRSSFTGPTNFDL
ncbi:glycosyl hydrolase [Aureococcus anophagefferens]|nr:glycosyl hydrolase [Aureococcus anophagefferens]